MSGGLSGFTFTDAFEFPGQISTRWLYTFQNGQTYYDWLQISPESDQIILELDILKKELIVPQILRDHSIHVCW